MSEFKITPIYNDGNPRNGVDVNVTSKAVYFNNDMLGRLGVKDSDFLLFGKANDSEAMLVSVANDSNRHYQLKRKSRSTSWVKNETVRKMIGEGVYTLSKNAIEFNGKQYYQIIDVQ